MTTQPHFTPALFSFLRELRENNDREWFQVHKERYEGDVRDPLLRFIADFAPPLHEMSAHFVADPRPVGGSLFRIYRDVRFSKDKSPYKTQAAAQFRHERGKDVHAPGFYLHLEPEEVFAGAGIWHPDTKSLTKIRDTIVANPAAWQRITSDDEFQRLCTLSGDSLKRAPKGFDPDHPLIGDLKRKDFVTTTSFTEQDACSPDCIDQLAQSYRAAAPVVEFLTTSLGLPY
ncbi:MAG: TIGR02453 family protein [Dehalococcoidia bacterium]|nr:TIGR02453 family protein [Dehalococcoidia bacterium]